jgi:predicted secreted Zn-dependent protease
MPALRFVPLLGLALSFALAATALATPLQTTKYTYYSVTGKTAAELYKAMLRYGPHVNGAKAYAATTATSSQDGKLQQAKNCQIENYRLKIDFVIRLPKLKNEAELPSSDRSKWRQFTSFLRRHEETHRSIWLGCAQELENKVRAIKADNCGDADAKASKLWDAMRRSCSAKHDAFDVAEQKRLLRHPFVRTVLKSRTDTAAAAAK